MKIENRSKSHLFLLEFIIIVLLFAFAAVVAVSFFVKAHEASEKSTDITCAMILAESTVEELLSGSKIPATANYNSDGLPQKEGLYFVDVNLKEKDSLTKVNICVSKEGKEIYTLETAIYQLAGEVTP